MASNSPMSELAPLMTSADNQALIVGTYIFHMLTTAISAPTNLRYLAL